jgi:hypothetical protein
LQRWQYTYLSTWLCRKLSAPIHVCSKGRAFRWFAKALEPSAHHENHTQPGQSGTHPRWSPQTPRRYEYRRACQRRAQRPCSRCTPALDTDDGVALVEHTELDGIHNTPLETAVNILLPWLLLEIGLLLGEVEGVYTAVQVRVPRGHCVACDHDDGADGTVFGDEAGGGTTGQN